MRLSHHVDAAVNKANRLVGLMQQSTNSPTPPTAGLCGGFVFWVSQKHKSPQPGAHFMSKPPDNPQVKPPPNRVG